jgi:4'-phosphopantetheinyl transferase
MQAATVWLLDSRTIDPAALATYEAWLGASERQRLAGFARQERRTQFVLGRALLRCALAPALGLESATIPLIERHANAPLLDVPRPAFFSISHSGPWIACAVSASTPLGLDIERIDAARDIAALAAQVCDAPQQVMLASLPAAQQARAFYQIWSTAEARVKLGVPAAGESVLPHPALSIVLCSAQPLPHAPVLLDGAPLLPKRQGSKRRGSGPAIGHF